MDGARIFWAGAWHLPTLSWVPAGRAWKRTLWCVSTRLYFSPSSNTGARYMMTEPEFASCIFFWQSVTDGMRSLRKLPVGVHEEFPETQVQPK